MTPWTVAHQASLSMGLLQARILEWVAILFSRGSSWLMDWTQFSCIAGRFFTIWVTSDTNNMLLPKFSDLHLSQDYLYDSTLAVTLWYDFLVITWMLEKEQALTWVSGSHTSLGIRITRSTLWKFRLLSPNPRDSFRSWNLYFFGKKKFWEFLFF